MQELGEYVSRVIAVEAMCFDGTPAGARKLQDWLGREILNTPGRSVEQAGHIEVGGVGRVRPGDVVVRDEGDHIHVFAPGEFLDLFETLEEAIA